MINYILISTQKMAEFFSLNTSLARMDSTMIDSSCKKMTRIELVYTVTRNMVRELSKIKDVEIPDFLKAYLEKGHKNQTIYKTRTDEENSKLAYLLQQAYDCFKWVQENRVSLDSVAFQHLKRLLEEQSVETEEGVVIPVDGKKISPQSLQNPSDPDAPFRYKAGHNHVGSVLNLVEVHDPEKELGLIMHADLKENRHSDAEFGEEFVTHHPLSEKIQTLAVDGAYFRQETIEKAEEKDIEMNFSQMTGRNVSDTDIGLNQFEIDKDTHKITRCPKGYEPTFSVYDSEKKVYTAKFYKQHCNQCPLKEFCQVKEQKKAFHISFSESKRKTDEIRSKIGSKRHKELSNYRAHRLF